MISSVRRILQRAWSFRGPNRGLVFAAGVDLFLLVCGLVAMPFDHRRILGLNPWTKPMKFEISITIFVLTMALLLDLLTQSGLWQRTCRRLSWGIGGSMVLEILVIAMQSARGVPSHMNYSTLFNGVAFAIMGVGVAVNTVLVAAVLVLFCRTRLTRPPAELLGIRLGLTMLLLASAEGVRIALWGSHTVGAPDGGPGLPFVNWSTRHGDLRVAHFFALHALQLLWFAGWRFSQSLASSAAVAATWIAAVAYAAGTWFLFAQAVAGQPLLSFLS